METETLLHNLFKQLDEHIKRIVDTRVAEIMQSQATLAFMNEELDKKIRDISADVAENIADESIRTHERDSEHIDEDMVVDIANNALNDYDMEDKIAEALRDADTPDESRVEEMISQAIDDIDMEEKVKEVLSTTEFKVSVS